MWSLEACPLGLGCPRAPKSAVKGRRCFCLLSNLNAGLVLAEGKQEPRSKWFWLQLFSEFRAPFFHYSSTPSFPPSPPRGVFGECVHQALCRGQKAVVMERGAGPLTLCEWPVSERTLLHPRILAGRSVQGAPGLAAGASLSRGTLTGAQPAGLSAEVPVLPSEAGSSSAGLLASPPLLGGWGPRSTLETRDC